MKEALDEKANGAAALSYGLHTQSCWFGKEVVSHPIVIFGSSRSRGDTWRAICALNATKPQLPVVDLNELNMSCYDYEHNNQQDDYLPLMHKVVQHDPIVLATPVYWYTMSAIMKIFIDRLTDLLTIRKDLGRKLAKKRVYVLASYGGSSTEGFEYVFRNTCDYMDMIYKGCFFYYSGDSSVLKKNNDDILLFRKRIDCE